MPTYVKQDGLTNQNNININSTNMSSDEQKRSSLSSSTSSSGNNDEFRQTSSNADYDQIRNQTLIFFLDRLFISSKDGKDTRTLHDLSCLFGTKEFTKEMRQIVGASRNGLKKFLQSYPSLFTIEDDKVYLAQLKPNSDASQVRDYHQEAVNYFREKLMQFGASLVPISNLFGYRSQASQEVRHVSGKSNAEFRQFLSVHNDVFELLDDQHVVLKSALNELKSRGESLQQLSSSSHDQVTDPYLNKQFAHLIEGCMKRMELEQQENGGTVKLTIEYLHEKVIQDCQNKLFKNMVKTIEEFKVFLRMHPNIFKRFRCDEDQCEYVSLLTEEERADSEIQPYQSLQHSINNNNSILKRSNTNESNLSETPILTNNQPISLPPTHVAQSTTFPDSHQTNSNTFDANSSNAQTINDGAVHSSLRASAPPFIPSNHLSKHVTNSVQRQQSSGLVISNKLFKPIQRSYSSFNSGSLTKNHHDTVLLEQSELSSCNHRGSIDLRLQRSYAPVKTSSVLNSSPNITNKQSNGTQYQSHESVSDSRTRTIKIVREASNIVTRIMSNSDAVAFDCKGYNLGFNGQITLIQFAFTHNDPQVNENICCVENEKPKPEVCIFDLITNPELAYCLKPLLESEQVVKIVHDVRNKSNALYAQFGIMLKHVFDTQVANLVIQQQETGRPAYKSRYISTSKLCEIYGDENLTKYRDLIKLKTRHSGASQNAVKLKDANYWRTRPLTDAMIYESTMDVYCLVGGIYQNLKSQIKPEYQPLFDQLNLEGVMALIKPEEVKSVKKQRKIDLEVIDLKRKLYSDTTNLIVLSNREIRLLRHIDLTDEVRQKIQHCKKVADKLNRLDVKALKDSQSMNSHMSLDGDMSIDPSTSLLNGSSLSSSGDSADQKTSYEAMNVTNDDDLLSENGITNLMDGSMFDELKFKMAESSSLLESLEDEDEEVVREVSLIHSRSHEKCSCICHNGSIGIDDKTSSPLKPSDSSNSKLDGKVTTSVTSGKIAVDMAIQCDLLS